MTSPADTAPGAVELKACPFCGSVDLDLDCYSRDTAGVCIEPAVNCNGCGGIFIFDFKLKEPWSDLAGSWNTRTHPSVATEGIVERLRRHAGETDRLVQMICTTAESLGVDVASITGKSDRTRYAGSVTMREAATLIEQQAATIAELREALERARPYVANVVEAEGAKFNRRDLFAIDNALNRSKGS